MADRSDEEILGRDWTPDDEEMMRRAFGTLRTEVDSVPLADVRFIKARGTARRRRRALAWTAGAAAAVVVAAVGFSALGGQGEGQTLPAGPTPSTTATSAPTVPGLTGAAGVLPVAAEWTDQLGASPALQAQPLKEFDSVDCMPTFPGPPDAAQTLYAEGTDPGAAGFQGTQAHFTASNAGEAATTAKTLVADLLACEGVPIEVTAIQSGDFAAGVPAVLTYTAENGAGGFYVVAVHGRDVGYLSISGGTTAPDVTADQVRTLADIAQARLLAYGVDGEDPTAPEGTSTLPPTTQTPGTVDAIDQDMPVVGPDPDYPSALFVAASQWASDELTRGYATEAAAGDYEGSVGVSTCDVDTEASGSVGIVSVRDRDGFIGKQKVRGATSIGDSDQQVRALEDAFSSGCTFDNGTVTAKPGPSERTWQLTTDFAEGDIARDVVEYVAVTPFGESLISTIVITDAPEDEDVAFAELDRLVALAVQK